MSAAKTLGLSDSDQLQGRRIGFYTSVVGMGGSEVIVADTMEAACRAGAEVVCWSDPQAAIRRISDARADRLRVQHRNWPPTSATPNGGETPKLRPPLARRSSLKAAALAAMPFAVKRYAGFHRTARAFQAELREVAPDLLFVNVNGSEAVSLAGPACGVPVVNCYHLSYTPPAGGLFTRFGDQLARRATIQSGTLTVHVSMAARDQWCSMFRYPADRTRVIYNGVEPPNLAPRESTRRALNLPSDAFVFCSPGRFDPIKGHTHLVDAMRLIKDRIGQAVLLLCGDGELRGVLEEQVTTSGLADKVRFLGWRDDVPAILHAADCMVLPSLSENLSLVAIESALVGTPSIVTRVGGMAEVVQDRSTGHIVPSAKPEALAEAMSWMVSNRQAAAEMGRLARADALNRFTRERMMAEYVATFADVLGRRT